MPLFDLLRAIEKADGPVSVRQLAEELDIEPSALEAMIDFWVEKGRLAVSGDMSVCEKSATCSACHPNGNGAFSCPLVLRGPTRIEVTKQASQT